MTPGRALASVRETMTTKVFGVTPSTKSEDALALASEHSVSHLPVVHEGEPVGVICVCDLEDAVSGCSVSALMHAPPITVEPNRTLAEAAEIMAARGVGSLLVVAEGELVGILTRSDFERVGLAEAAFGDRRCSRCGSFHHVQDDGGGYLMCHRCRAEQRSAGAA